MIRKCCHAQVQARPEWLLVQALWLLVLLAHPGCSESSSRSAHDATPVDQTILGKDAVASQPEGSPSPADSGVEKELGVGEDSGVLAPDQGVISSNLPPGSWQLIWNDEFSGSSGSPPDASKWFFFDGWSSARWRDAWYTDEDAFLDGQGHLVIRSRIDSADGDKYKTSYIQTYHWSHPTQSWTTFGPGPGKYFECRCKLDELEALGQWAAFWLFDPSDTYDGDPSNGTEIDIMEYLLASGFENKFNVANHWGSSLGQFINAADYGIDLRDGNFHTFGLEWTPSTLTYYIDGKEVWTCTEGVSTSDEQAIILSIEIADDAWGQGGVFAEHADKLPDAFVVDYVRVFEKL